MKKVIKKWKVFLMLCVLALSFSITAYASETDNAIDLTDNADFIIEFVDDISALTYTGMAFEPEVKVLYGDTVLDEDTDYIVEYKNNVNAGQAEVTVKGINAYTGERALSFVINAADIDNAEIILSSGRMAYKGYGREPGVTVKYREKTLVKNTDYIVSFSNNVNLGIAKAIITGRGNYTGTKTATYEVALTTPKISLGTAYNKISVSWKKVTGATSYRILRSTSKDSGFETIKFINSDSVFKYIDTDVEFNQTYYYKVRAYRTGEGKSNYSEVKAKTVRPAQASVTGVSRVSYTSLKVAWKKVAGASGYGIYRSTSENGEYERIGTAKGGSTLGFTDKGLVCGRTYYYKVRAYRTVSGKNYYGASSAAKSTYTRPAKVSLSAGLTTYNSTKITLTWKKAAGAEGYQIYRSTSKDSGYTKVKTITSGSTLSWADTGLTKGQVYYYKVRAYCKTDGKTVFGAFSSVFTKTKAGWKYTTYDGKKVKLYYNASGKLVKDVSNLIGKQSSYVIKVNKQKCTVTVYAKDGSNGYIIPVKSFVCSPGYSTPPGTYYTPQKYRWHELMGPCWGQWCTRITGGILFHSVYYNSYNNNNTLSVSAYNKLGTICSHGCVRLAAGDAKWIYDNCKLKTKVIIYNSSAAGPLGKPTASKLASWHTWDPTDPNMKSKCAKRGCH